MKLKKAIFIFSLCVYSLQFFAQTKKPDSLLKVLKAHPSDTVGAKTCFQMGYFYMHKGDMDSAYVFFKKGFGVSKQLNFVKGLAISSNFLGQIYSQYGNQDSAIYYFTKSMRHYETMKDSSRTAGMLNNIGVVYKNHGNISKAMDYFFQSLKIKERLNDTSGAANAYTNIGHIYSQMNDTANTIKYHKQALRLRELAGDLSGVANSNMAIGLFYQNTNQFKQALPYLQKGLALSEELGEEESIAVGCYNLANLYYKEKKIDEALKLYNRAFDISKKTNNQEGMASCLETLGQIAFDKKDLKSAIKLFEEAYSFAKIIDNKDLIGNITYRLAVSYEIVGDYKKALTYNKISTTIKDSLFNVENTRKLTSKGLIYEHEKEKILLEKEQAKKEEIAKANAFKKDLIIGVSVILFLVISIFTFIIFKRLKENRKQKNIIELQRNEMIDSINYARRIQFALLAHQDFLAESLPHHFVLFKPKDIVSGDFYWATKKDGFFYIAVCDSTGHGVPGAFMSLLNISFLNEAINEKNIAAPNEALNHVRKRLLENMDGGRDGMDAVLLKIDLKNPEKIEYAAANNSPVVIRNSEIINLPKDKMPVGKGENMKSFNLYSFDIKKNDLLYLYTDGFADQFGGEKGKKFKYKQLNELLLSVSGKSPIDQEKVLNSSFENWKGKLEQVDDVCVIGIRF